MRKFIAITILAGALGGVALLASPDAKAASVVSVAETAIVDVVQDMSLIHQVRSNRYKEQMRHHLQMGRRGDAYALRQISLSLRQGVGRYPRSHQGLYVVLLDGPMNGVAFLA